MTRHARLRTAASALRYMTRTPPRLGWCPTCSGNTVFVAVGDWLREDLKCARCRSSSRQRAISDYLTRCFADLETLKVYEPSPSRPSLRYFEQAGAQYTWSVYSLETRRPAEAGVLIENLESLTFSDEAFDLAVSQDVLEHINDPRRAFAEISRILGPGGSHLFTVPWYPDRPTQRRAERRGGRMHHFGPPEYHADPFDDNGSLVFTRFGADIGKIIEECSGMKTEIIRAQDSRQGIQGDSIVLFHSVKPDIEAGEASA